MGRRFGVALVLATLAAGCSGGDDETAPPVTDTRPAAGTTTPGEGGDPVAGDVVELEDWGPEGGTRGTVTLRDAAGGVEVGLALDRDIELATLGPLSFWDNDCQSEYLGYTVGEVSVPTLSLEPRSRRWTTTIRHTSTDELGAVSVGFARMVFLCGDL